MVENNIPLTLDKTIVLVGLMGCGKSAIGKRLAKKLEVPFKDMDTEIEKQCGCSVSMIFDVQGEAYFREKEKEVIKELLAGEPCIVATGGGAFINEEVRKIIQENAVSVWLKADYDLLLDRVARKTTRPLLEQGNKAEILKNLMDERYPIYAQAHKTVLSETGSHDRMVSKVIKAISEE